MSGVNISRQRLKELEFAEKKLLLLEGHGVDNWDGYDDAISDLNYEESIARIVNEAIASITEVLSGAVYEPSEKGAGYSFKDAAVDHAEDILRDYVNTILDRERARE